MNGKRCLGMDSDGAVYEYDGRYWSKLEPKEPTMNPRPLFNGNLYTLADLIDFRYKLEKWAADAELKIAKLNVLLDQHKEVNTDLRRHVADLKSSLAARDSTVARQKSEIEALHKVIYSEEQALKDANKRLDDQRRLLENHPLIFKEATTAPKPASPIAWPIGGARVMAAKVKDKPWWVLLLELLGWRETRYDVTYEFEVKELPPSHPNCRSSMDATFLPIYKFQGKDMTDRGPEKKGL